MAVLREPNYCPFCGELIKEIHDKQEGIPWMLQRIGDNFLRYEDHVCNKDKKEAWLKDHPLPESPDLSKFLQSFFK